MEKIISKVITIVLLMLVFFSSFDYVKAAGGNSTMSASSTVVNIGDTVSVTLAIRTEADSVTNLHMKITYDKEVLKYSKSSDTDCNGANGELNLMKDISGSYSITITFVAIAPAADDGETEILANTHAAYIQETGEKTTVSGSKVLLKVNNDVTPPGNPSDPGGNDNPSTTDKPGGTTAPTKSSDNSLKSLTISPGTLSPKFKYSTMKYKATVASDVTSVVVDAQVSNEKATVKAVTGNTNLKVGENTIKIVVKAENGKEATYTIIVTRSAGTVENPGETPNPPAEEPDEKTEIIDGVSYKVSGTLPEQTLPEEFTKTSVSYNGKEVEGYAFPYEDLRLLYLTPTENSSAAGSFYIYNAEKKQFFPYINITVGQVYILVLPTSYSTTLLPEGYREADVTIGTHTVSAYQLTADSATAEGVGDQKANAFYLIYGVDKDGIPGWYQYDADNMSAQRFNEAAYAAGASQEASQYIEAYNQLLDKHNKEKSRDRIIMAALIFTLAVAIIAIVNILIFGRKGKNGEDEDVDYVDLDDF